MSYTQSLSPFPNPQILVSDPLALLFSCRSRSLGTTGSCPPDPASEPMDSPSSVSSYSSYSLSSFFSTSPVNSDFGSPSDSEGEDKWAHGPKPDTVGQKEGSRPSPGPIRCRQRPKVSSNQHVASHSEQRGLAASMSGSGVKRSRDGELETCINIQGCTTEGDLLFAQKVRESWESETGPEWFSIHLVDKDPTRSVLAPRLDGKISTGAGSSWSSHTICPVFLQCKELQGFIPPLTDLLKGLKMGRFERGNYLISCIHLS